MVAKKSRKELSNTKKLIFIGILVLILIQAIVGLVLVIQAYSSLNESVELLEDVKDNWETGTIAEITVTDDDCPSGYDMAYNYVWGGSGPGCWCRDASTSDKNRYNVNCDLCQGSCSTNETRAGCTDIDQTSSRRISEWGDSTGNDGGVICVKRTDETFAKHGVFSGSSCPSDYTKCGETAEEVFCTKEDECPIAEVKIERKSVASNLAACVADNDCYVIRNDGTNFYRLTYRRSDQADLLPLVEWNINEDSMCKRRDKKSKTSGRTDFALLRDSRTSCGGEGDDLWIELDEQTERDIFISNGIYSDVLYLDNYGFYSSGRDGDDYDWRLFVRGYVPFDIGCRDDMERLLDEVEDVQALRTSQLVLLIVTIIATIALGIVLVGMEIANLCGYDLPCVDGDGEEERKRLKRFKRIINYGFKLLQLPFQIYALVTVDTFEGFFHDLSDRECSSGGWNPIFTDLADDITVTRERNTSSLIVLCVFTCLDIVMSCLQSKNDKKEASYWSDANKEERERKEAEIKARDQAYLAQEEAKKHQADGGSGFNNSTNQPQWNTNQGGYPQQQGGPQGVWDPNQNGGPQGYNPQQQQGGWNPQQQQQQPGGWNQGSGGQPQTININIVQGGGDQQQQGQDEQKPEDQKEQAKPIGSQHVDDQEESFNADAEEGDGGGPNKAQRTG